MMTSPVGQASNPWAIYDRMIAMIPDAITVTACAVSQWTVVTASNGGCGIVFTSTEGPDVGAQPQLAVGMELREVASWVKSWNFVLASIGQAALNCFFNTAERLSLYPASAANNSLSCFSRHLDALAGHSVTMIGHFKDADRIQSRAERLTILERQPRDADLPDPACEYVLAESDWVYMTGETLLNKTMPRLIALCRNPWDGSDPARITLVGPSVTFAPEVFLDAVAEFAGVIVTDPTAMLAAVQVGGGHRELKPHYTSFNVCFAETGLTPDPVDTYPEFVHHA